MAERRKPDSSDLWVETYGDLPPLGYVLREAVPHRWTRFHALPRSKRYAETPEERATILERANKLADKCLRTSSEVWVIRESGRHYPKVADPSETLDWNFLLHWEMRDEPDDVIEYDFEFTRVEWQARQFDWLLTAIADDKTRALFFSLSDGAVFAPYDGGFDLILPSPREVAEFEATYRGWMSELTSKL